MHFCGEPRKHYIIQKVNTQGRGKIESSDQASNLVLSEEILQWALESKIPEHGGQSQQIRPHQIQKIREEEQRRVNQLTQENFDGKRREAKLKEEVQQYAKAYEALKAENAKQGGIIPASISNYLITNPVVQQVQRPATLQKENLPPKV